MDVKTTSATEKSGMRQAAIAAMALALLLPSLCTAGITYDATDNCLWVVDFSEEAPLANCGAGRASNRRPLTATFTTETAPAKTQTSCRGQNPSFFALAGVTAYSSTRAMPKNRSLIPSRSSPCSIPYFSFTYSTALGS